MSSEAAETGPPRGRRRWRFLRRAMLALALLVVGLYLSRNAVLAPVLLRFAREAAADAGYELEIGEVGGSWLRDLELWGVGVEAARADVPLRRASIARARIRYDLLTLVRGDLAGLLALELDAPDVDLDLTATAPSVEPEDPRALFELPAHLPEVSLREGRVRLRLDAEQVLTIEELAAMGTDEITLSLRAALAPELAPLPPELALSGAVSLDEGVLRIRGLRVADLAEVRMGSVDPVTGSSAFEGALLGAELAASARFEGGAVALSLSVEELDVGAALALIDEELGADSAGRLSLSVEGELPLDAVLDARASARLRLAEVSFRGEGVEEATAELELENRVARVSSLSARRAGVELVASDVSGPIDFSDLGALLDGSRGRLTLDAPDVGTAAGAWLPEDVRALGPLTAELVLSVEGRTVQVEAGGAAAPGLLLAFDGGELTLPAGWPIAFEDAAISLDGLLEAPDLALLPGSAAGALEAGRATIGLIASGTLGAPRIDAVVAAAGARMPGDAAPPLDQLDATLELTLERLRIPLLDVRSGEAHLVLRDAELPVPAGGEPSEIEAALRALSARLEVRAPDLAVLVPELGQLGPLATEIEARLDGLVLVLDTASVEGANVAVSTERGVAQIEHFPPESGADVSVDLALSARLADLGALAAWFPEGTPASGRGELTLAVMGDLGAPTGSLSLVLDAPALGSQALDTATLEASAGPEGRRVELLALGGPHTRVRLVATDAETMVAHPGRVELAVLEVGPEDDPLALVAPGMFEWTANGFELQAALGRAGEVLAIDARQVNGAISAELRATELELDPWLERWLPAGTRAGRLTARLSASVAGEALTVEGSLRLTDLVAREHLPAFDVHTDALALRDAAFELLEPLVVAAPGFALELGGRAPLDPFGPTLLPDGAVSFAGSLDLDTESPLALFLPSAARPTSGDVAATLTLGGTWTAPDARLALRSRGLLLPDPQVAGRDMPTELFLDVRAGRELVIEKLDVAVGELVTARLSGRTAVAFEPRAWLAGATPPPLSGAQAEWHAALDVPSLAALGFLFPDVRRAGGALRGTLEAHGSLSDPALEGEVVLEAGELKLEGGLPLIEGLSARIVAKGNTLLVERVAGEAGGAPFEVRGTVELGGDPRLALTVTGSQLLLHRADRVRIRGDADLAVEGTAAHPRITGTIALRDSVFAQRVDLLGMARDAVPGMGGDSGARPAELDDTAVAMGDLLPPGLELAIEVDSLEPVAVRNNLATGGVRPKLRLTTLEGLPTLEGVVYMDRTRLSLPAGRVWITSGTVRFRADRPLWPKIELMIEGRLHGHDLTIGVVGDPEELVLSPSSVPPLPHEDLLVLVLTGEPPKGGVGASGSAAASSLALYVATNTIYSWFASDSLDAEESLVDRIEFSLGRDVSKDGTKSTEVTFRLVEQWLASGDTLYLTGEQDVHGDLNGGLRLVFRFD